MRVITKTNVQIDLPDGTYLELFDPDPRVVAYLESIESAVKAEREACAKVCEKEAVQIVIDGPEERAYNNAVSDCVSAIRARGTNGQ